MVFCGDVINRGPAIADCMNLVWELVCAGRATWLRGNHEQTLIQGLEQSPASGHGELLTIDTYRQLGDGLSRQWLQRLRQLPEVFQGEGWVAPTPDLTTPVAPTCTSVNPSGITTTVATAGSLSVIPRDQLLSAKATS
ncbi:calcineurin-like phosphoesterase family protein/ ApaH type [Synechococcus sp. MEDNS5]|nr:calcineurin-like phosphoesterase family protein/ ApaH type [Synechococcus sp. MEDNS5]